MAKRLAIKVGEFTNQQGETKGEYARLGVMMDGQNGPYLLLDPSISLGGCLAKQNMMNHKAGKEIRNSVMVSVFDDSQQQQGGQQQAPQGQQAPQQQGGQQQTPSNNFDGFDDDIPF